MAVEINVNLVIIQKKLIDKGAISHCRHRKAQVSIGHAYFRNAVPARSDFNEWLGERQGRRVGPDPGFVEYFLGTLIDL